MPADKKQNGDPRAARKAAPKVAEVPAAAPVAKADDNKQAYVPMQIGLPELPTGGTLATWKSDLARIKSISVSKDDSKTWITIQGSGKVVPPPDQVRAVTFLALSRISSPTSDRGMAYRLWAHTHKAILLERLGKYLMRVEFGTKSILPGFLCTVQQALATNDSEYVFLSKSLEAFAPRKREASTKVDTEVTYDVIL